MNLIDAAKQFATPEACVDYLEAMRWPDGVTCLQCGGSKVSRIQTNDTERTRKNAKGEIRTVRVPGRIVYQCQNPACTHQFSVTTGTIFHDTHLPLDKWFAAVALMVNAKKGLSALQLKRDLGCAYKTAWYLAHRIREAMIGSALAVFEGVVEADATFVGGKYDPRRKRAKYGKQPVFGLVQRKTDAGCSKVMATPVEKEIREVVTGVINDRVSQNATIYTDEHAAYRLLGKTRKHAIVIHTSGQYVQGDVHSNSIENFWSLFKRGLIGSYHQVSVKHLQRYLAEFTYRFNNREEENLFGMVVLNLLAGIALEYKRLTAGAAKNTGKGPEVELDGEPF
jgi:transposase-like protein